MTVSAVIPTIGATELLFDLLQTLEADRIATVVYDNGCAGEVRERLNEVACTVVDAQGMGLYEMWDRGVEDAGTDYVAVLNDDIVLLPGTVAALAAALAKSKRFDLVSADYTRRVAEGLRAEQLERVIGTYRMGGVCGWCFVVRRTGYPGVGEGYGWWCGDDELVSRIEAKGHRVGILRGVPVDHVGNASGGPLAWTHESKIGDLELWASRWT